MLTWDDIDRVYRVNVIARSITESFLVAVEKLRCMMRDMIDELIKALPVLVVPRSRDGPREVRHRPTNRPDTPADPARTSTPLH